MCAALSAKSSRPADAGRGRRSSKAEPSTSSASGELWGFHFMPDQLTVDVLMPNGLLISVYMSRNSTLQAIKENVWKEARRMPLYQLLQAPSAYVFTLVTRDGKSEEIYDETRRLCDLRIFLPVLRLLEPEGNVEEKTINYLISQAVGRSVVEFDESRDAELIRARLEYFKVCREVCDETERDFQKALCRHYCQPFSPPAGRRRAPVAVRQLNSLLLCVWIPSTVAMKIGPSTVAGSHRNKVTMKMRFDVRPGDVVRELLARVSKSNEEGADGGQPACDRYVLKQPSRQLYFLSDVELVDYAYVRSCLADQQLVNMVLTERADLLRKVPVCKSLVPSFVKRQTASSQAHEPSHRDSVCMWNMQSNFRIKIISTYNINVTSDDYVYVKAGIFFGPHRLSVHGTSAIACSDLRWNEVLEFDLPIYQIPLGAHISFSLCSIRQKKQKDARCPLGWINLRVIDYQDCLIQGKRSLYMWPFPKAFEGLFNPVGQLGPNSNRSVPCLQVDFGNHERRIRFPSHCQRHLYGKFFEKGHHHHKHHARHCQQRGRSVGRGRFLSGGRLLVRSSLKEHHWSSPLAPIVEITERERAFICDELINRDPLHEMQEEERRLIWRCRHFLQTVPESLPRLLDAVCWTNTSDVCELYSLLHGWPTVGPLVAMELLDVRYPDNYVRRFAVQCLNKTLTDDQLSMYLIYLVQVMKYEPFLLGDLGKFLLCRALLNAQIGHQFFWLVRVELAHNPRCNRFGLLLEAYCRGVGDHLQQLVRQVNTVDKLCTLGAAIKERREDWAKLLQERMRQPDYLEALQNLCCPLDHTVALGELVVDECHVICSAKRPLLLVWRTDEPIGELQTTVEILFKMGDDLRQDMLTLQVLKSMDSIWKAESRDFALTPYTSLPMGKHVGMIQIVKKSKTIMEILSIEGRKGAFNIGSSQTLYRYIRHVSSKEGELEAAIDRFTKSCAGYCVATFVLGIGDRHPSNIMITDDGRIFHVDFGHFLGHYKKKLGISRERVPFVLTDDFIRVIARGAENAKKSKEFEAFQQLCGEAYLILHRHARLFITLFTMMLCMGVPELQKLEDINYMRKTLAADRGDHEALKHFNEQLNRAYEGAWTTKVDWFFHSVKHM